MNRHIGNKLIEISTALKAQKMTGRNFHVSFALLKNKIISIGWNDYNKGHSVKRFGQYKNYKGYPNEYMPSRHSESHLVIRLGEEDLRDYEIVNVRIDNNGNPSLSAPCKNCLNSVLLPFGAKKIYYTNNDGVFEKLIF